MPVFNTPELVRWNIRKTYLRDFESRGVPIIPDAVARTSRSRDIRDAFAEFGTDDVVLKRQVGGGARAQVRYTRANMPDEVPSWTDPA